MMEKRFIDEHVQNLRNIFSKKLDRPLSFVSLRGNFLDEYVLHGFANQVIDGQYVRTYREDPVKSFKNELNGDVVALVVVRHVSTAPNTSRLMDVMEYIKLAQGDEPIFLPNGTNRVLVVDLQVAYAVKAVTDCAMASFDYVGELEEAGRVLVND